MNGNKQVNVLLTEILPGANIDLRSGAIEFTPKPTPTEELLYKFVIVGADTIAYMGQHARGRAYVDDLNEIFHGACQHIIARQAAGMDFTYLNPVRLSHVSTSASKTALGFCVLCGEAHGQPHAEDCPKSARNKR